MRFHYRSDEPPKVQIVLKSHACRTNLYVTYTEHLIHSQGVASTSLIEGILLVAHVTGEKTLGSPQLSLECEVCAPTQ